MSSDIKEEFSLPGNIWNSLAVLIYHEFWSASHAFVLHFVFDSADDVLFLLQRFNNLGSSRIKEGATGCKRKKKVRPSSF